MPLKYWGSKQTEIKTMREQIFINGHIYYLDRNKMKIYENKNSNEDDGISVYSGHLTKNEKRQIEDYIKYGR